MEKNNKIIPFKQKMRQKSEFKLKAEISIYICRECEKFTCDCTSSNNNHTIEDIIKILKKILLKLSKEIGQFSYQAKDSYKLTFTLLYYEDINNKNNFKYLCLPKDIKLEKLAEYLFTFISIYEYKKSGAS